MRTQIQIGQTGAFRLSPAKSSSCSVGTIQSKGFNFGADEQGMNVYATGNASKLSARAAAIELWVTISQSFFGHFLFKRKCHRNNIYLKSLVVASTLYGCSLPTQPDLLVSSLRCSPSAFDSFRANTEIRYTLAKPTTVTIYIAQRNSSGQLILINSIAENINETKGSHGHTWLGDTAAGLFAESGNYIAVLQIESNQYEAGVRVFHF